MDRLRHSKAAVVAVFGTALLLIIAAVVGLVEIVIPTMINAYNATVSSIATTYVNIQQWVQTHPNWQFPIIIIAAITITFTLHVLAYKFHVHWAKKIFEDFFD